MVIIAFLRQRVEAIPTIWNQTEMYCILETKSALLVICITYATGLELNIFISVLLNREARLRGKNNKTLFSELKMKRDFETVSKS